MLLLFVLAAQAEATVYHVKASGGTTGNCSTAVGSSDPGIYLRTITAGLACIGASAGAGANQIVEVHAGTYTANLDEAGSAGQFMPKGSSWAAPFTLRAAAGETVIVKPNSGGFTLRFFGPSAGSNNFFTVITGITWDGTNLSEGNIAFAASDGGPAHVLFQNNSVVNTALNNHIYIGPSSSDVQIIGNSLHDGTQFGTGGDTAGAGHGVYLETSNAIVDGNDIYNIQGFGIHQYSNVSPAFSPTNNIIRNNRIHNFGLRAGAAGILAGTGSGAKVYSNIIYQGFTNGGTFCPSGITTGFGASNHQIYENTIYGNCIGIESRNTSSGDIWRNNISTSNTTNESYAGVGVVHDHNLTANPSFQDAANGNFHLTAGSTNAINQGVDLSLISSMFSTDFTSIARPQGGGWDIGAYEFVSAPLPTVVITSPTSSPTFTTSSATINLSGTSTLP